MSNRCHVCGPVKHECPTEICAPCALDSSIWRTAVAQARLGACLVDARPRRRYR